MSLAVGRYAKTDRQVAYLRKITRYVIEQETEEAAVLPVQTLMTLQNQCIETNNELVAVLPGFGNGQVLAQAAISLRKIQQGRGLPLFFPAEIFNL